jgi:hypothetical protein
VANETMLNLSVANSGRAGVENPQESGVAKAAGWQKPIESALQLACP